MSRYGDACMNMIIKYNSCSGVEYVLLWLYEHGDTRRVVLNGIVLNNVGDNDQHFMQNNW